MDFDSKAFGRAVSNYRNSLNLTQEELAERAGIGTSYLGAIEIGYYNPSAITVNALLNAFGISYDDCIRGVLNKEDLLYSSVLNKYHSVDLTPKDKQFLLKTYTAINKRHARKEDV